MKWFFAIIFLCAFQPLFCLSEEYRKTFFIAEIETDFNESTFDSNELEHLFGFGIGDTVCQSDLDDAKRVLLHKDIIESVDFSLQPLSGNRWKLICQMQSIWQFESLICTGVGDPKKSYYASLYHFKKGDPFFLSFHESSITFIRKVLFDRGYLAAKVESELVFDFSKKLINVKLLIEKGSKFVVANVITRLSGQVGLQSELIRNKIAIKAKHYLLKRACKKQTFCALENDIHESLHLHSVDTISCWFVKKINFDESTVEVILNVGIGRGAIAILHGAREFMTESVGVQGVVAYQEKLTPLIDDVLQRTGRLSGVMKTQTGDCSKKDSFKKQLTGKYQVRIAHVETGLDDSISALLNDALVGHPLNAHSLKVALKKGIQQQVKNGFWNFCYRTIDIDLLDEQWCQITLDINPGMKRTYEEQGSLNVMPGNRTGIDPFLLKTLHQEHVQLQRSKGFWNGRTQTLLKESHQNDTESRVHLSRVYEQDNPVKFGKVIVHGSSVIPFSKIEKSMAFRTGEPWSEKKLYQSKSQLEELGVFKGVRLSIGEHENCNSCAPVIVSLVDDDPFELSLRAGLLALPPSESSSVPSDYVHFDLGSSLLGKNLFGVADSFELSCDFDQQKRTAGFLYRHPHPFGSNIRFIWQGDLVCWPKTSHGNTPFAAAGWQLVALHGGPSTGWEIRSGIGAERIWNRGEYGAKSFKDRYFIHPAVLFDNLSGYWDTRFGNVTTISTKFFLDKNEVQLSWWKLDAEYAHFQPLFEDICLGFRVRGRIVQDKYTKLDGHATIDSATCMDPQVHSFETFLPLQDRSFLRQESVHSYRQFVNHEENVSGVLLSSELRLHLYKKLKLSCFQNAILDCDRTDKSFSWNAFSGGGLRYILPVGVICADVAYHWGGGPSFSKGWTWRVALGHFI